jgi:hypothetical protein
LRRGRVLLIAQKLGEALLLACGRLDVDGDGRQLERGLYRALVIPSLDLRANVTCQRHSLAVIDPAGDAVLLGP